MLKTSDFLYFDIFDTAMYYAILYYLLAMCIYYIQNILTTHKQLSS